MGGLRVDNAKKVNFDWLAKNRGFFPFCYKKILDGGTKKGEVVTIMVRSSDKKYKEYIEMKVAPNVEYVDLSTLRQEFLLQPCIINKEFQTES